MAWSKTGTLRALGSPVTTVTPVSGTATCDLSLGDYFKFTLTANTTIAFTNPPASGTGRTVQIDVTQNGTGGWTLSGLAHPIGSTPTAIQSGAGVTTRIAIGTTDAGTTYPYTMGKIG